MPTTAEFTALGNERFVSLTTFRKNGEAVSTAVWIAADGDELIVVTPAESGKVKRLRNSDRVEMRPCNRAGRVDEDATIIAGTATIVEDQAGLDVGTAILGVKYGLEYRIVMFIERLGKSGNKQRVLLRITPA